MVDASIDAGSTAIKVSIVPQKIKEMNQCIRSSGGW